MIRVMMVDDELPALKMAESILRSFEEIEICGAFSEQDDLLEALPLIDVDLIFMDIKMPGMHGMELAGRVNEIKPEVEIVFATAYDHYAVEAFETEAIDFVLKPMTEERIRKTLDRYLKRRKNSKNKKASQLFKVNFFGRFVVQTELGEKLKFRTAKAEELFAFLIHHQGQLVSKEKIFEELWFDRDTERAQSIFYTTLYQLRKDLDNFGLNNIIQSSRKDGGICTLTWFPDYWDLKDYQNLIKQFKAGRLNPEGIKQAIEIYQDGYLIQNAYMWATGRQAELELTFLELMETTIDIEVRNQKFEVALLYLKKMAKVFPFSATIHSKIIAVYVLLNNREAAKDYYRNVEKEIEFLEKIKMDTLLANPYSAFDKNK